MMTFGTAQNTDLLLSYCLRTHNNTNVIVIRMYQPVYESGGKDLPTECPAAMVMARCFKHLARGKDSSAVIFSSVQYVSGIPPLSHTLPNQQQSISTAVLGLWLLCCQDAATCSPASTDPQGWNWMVRALSQRRALETCFQSHLCCRQSVNHKHCTPLPTRVLLEDNIKACQTFKYY